MGEAAEKDFDEDVIEDRGDLLEPEVEKEEGSVEKNDEAVAKGETDSKDEEGDEEPTAEKPEKAPKTGIKVPKFRLDAATARARAAEERAAALEAELEAARAKKTSAEEQTAQTPEQTLEATLADIDAKLADAMKDGDTAEVTKLMAAARKAERDYLRDEMHQTAEKTRVGTTSEVAESGRVNSILDQLESEYPIFDANSDTYNQEANDAVLNLQTAFMAQGKSPSTALLEAINYVLPSLGYTFEDVEEKPAEKPAGRKTDVKKNLDTEKRQPAALDDKTGDDSDAAGQKGDTPDARDLTEEEFDALPEATKRIMRGDIA